MFIITAEYLNLRTKDGLAMEFALAQYGDIWRVYLLSPIDYKGRPDDLYITCRQCDEHGLIYICWYPPPLSLEVAEAVATTWAEMTATYIRTGESICSQYSRAYYGGRGHDP